MSYEIIISNVDNEIIYERPFSSGNMMQRWSEVANKIDLPLISKFYDEGFYSGISLENLELYQLSDELKKIKKYFDESGYERSCSQNIDGAVKRTVFDIIDRLEVALEIALKEQGTLMIT